MVKLYILNSKCALADISEPINPCSEKKTSSFVGHELLKAVLTTDYNMKSEDIILKKGQHGKPYLQSQNGIFFNISHSGTYVAVAVSQSEIGVDIEVRSNPNLKISERFFTKNEQQYLSPETNGANERFYEIWTKKEAYLKRMGQGLSAGLKSFDVTDKSVSLLFSTFKTEELTVAVCCDDTDVEVVGFEKVEEMFKRYCTNSKYMVR